MSLLSNEINDCVCEDETILCEYQKICSGIQYIDSRLNDKIIKELMEFKEMLKK